MSKGQTIAVVLVVLIVAVAFVGVAYIQKDVAVKNAEIAAEINAQSEIQKTKIEEEEATKRTKERMGLIPWYSKEEGKE